MDVDRALAFALADGERLDGLGGIDQEFVEPAASVSPAPGRNRLRRACRRRSEGRSCARPASSSDLLDGLSLSRRLAEVGTRVLAQADLTSLGPALANRSPSRLVTLIAAQPQFRCSVIRHADAVAVVVVAPARALASVGRAAVRRGRGRGRADQGARARADRRAGQGAAGASVRDRGSDERACARAERPADQGVLLLRGLAGRDRNRDGERRRQSQHLFHGNDLPSAILNMRLAPRPRPAPREQASRLPRGHNPIVQVKLQ